MDFLNDILGANTSELIGAVLKQTDMGREEAESFVPEAGQTVAKALAGSAGDLNLSQLASAANVAALLKQIDIGALAGRVGVSREKSSAGLSALLPMLLSFIGDNDKAVGALKALSQADGAMDTLKGLGGKLFG